MRAVVQRVREASVTVDGQVVGRIDRGLLVYAGVAAGDGPEDAAFIAKKVRYLRVFADAAGKLNLDASQAGGSVLVVSNFTLLADTRQGRRPAFTAAAPPALAETLVDRLCGQLRQSGLSVETGRFGALMSVVATNDGPINILIDSRRLF